VIVEQAVTNQLVDMGLLITAEPTPAPFSMSRPLNFEQSFSLLRLQGRWLLYLDDRRGIPLAGQRLAFRCIDPHREVEWSLRRWQPIGLLVGTRAFALEIEIE
jgi:hypothetical protein